VIELMVVIGIAAIMVSILAVAIRQGSESFALRRAGSLAAAEIRRAQASAIAERRDFVVEFDFGDPAGMTTYRLTDASTWEQVRAIGAPQAGMDAEWPTTVSFASAAVTPFVSCGVGLPGATTNQCVGFGLFGEPLPAAPAGQVLIRNRTGTELRIVVAPATGRVTIAR
jgi:type II secretory pathway pseudopilin PulG